ncbi:MAG: 50S ribosomal protein L11 methyltransferase [Paramuribaculum sp.]|nr:50S ribosomal protein L11 methyltransferase [Paramuribaculum sp.]
MTDYMEVKVTLSPFSEPVADVLAAVLADAGFESFVTDEPYLTAYIRADRYSDDMAALVDELPFEGVSATWEATFVEGRDWNSEWEKHYFQPIVVGEQCVIHSSFHTDIPRCRYDIVIDPKMAFGTGHHFTTRLILQRLLKADLEGKSMIDVGTGTAILAILAAMRGAAPVTGIEIDEGAYLNAIENVSLNHVASAVSLILGDASALAQIQYEADLLTANINRNVITADLPAYAKSVKSGGTVLLSGFYRADVAIVREAAEACGLTYISTTDDNDWACVELVKP